jgi:hypothetical protein
LQDAGCWRIAIHPSQEFFMIGYVTLGTNDMPRVATFYDALLGELGAKWLMETDR